MQTLNIKQFRAAIDSKYPYLPETAEKQIIFREANRPGAQTLSTESYVMLAIASVAGYIRHRMTAYDLLLDRMTRAQARDRVRHEVERITLRWEGK